jgi:sarcosine oxidase subunit beta
MRTADVLVIGGGVIGCSIAHHLLKRDRTLRVIVLEREPMVGMGSTSKATGGIRHQFSSEANIRLTQISLPVYRQFEEETGHSVHFRAHGYLFLTSDPQALEGLRRAVAVQQSVGVVSRIISAEEAGKLVPGLRTDDLLGGSMCDQDGTAEPAAAVQGFASRARAMGAQILTGPKWSHSCVTAAGSAARARPGMTSTRRRWSWRPARIPLRSRRWPVSRSRPTRTGGRSASPPRSTNSTPRSP